MDNRDMKRRHPLKGVAAKVSASLAVLGGVATSLATIGAINADQSSAAQGVLTAVAGLVAAVTGALAAFGVVRRGEPLVTPVADPRADDGTKLVSIPGA